MTDYASLMQDMPVAIIVRLIPCGYSEPESNWRDHDTGAHRTAYCEGGKLVVRGNYIDSFTNGSHFISARKCPRCQP